jgi:hypothetical protein
LPLPWSRSDTVSDKVDGSVTFLPRCRATPCLIMSFFLPHQDSDLSEKCKNYSRDALGFGLSDKDAREREATFHRRTGIHNNGLMSCRPTRLEYVYHSLFCDKKARDFARQVMKRHLSWGSPPLTSSSSPHVSQLVDAVLVCHAVADCAFGVCRVVAVISY